MRKAARLILAVGAWATVGSAARAAAETTSASAPPVGVISAQMSAPVSTAPDATSDQIAQWLAAPDTAPAAPEGDAVAAPRKIHGEAGVGFGSNGYHSAYAVVDMPIGESSDLGVAVSDVHYGHERGFRGGDSKSIAISLNIGTAGHGSAPWAGRCAVSPYAEAGLAPTVLSPGPGAYPMRPAGYALSPYAGAAGCASRFDQPDAP